MLFGGRVIEVIDCGDVFVVNVEVCEFCFVFVVVDDLVVDEEKVEWSGL